MGSIYEGIKFYFGLMIARILISLAVIFVFVIFVLSIIVAIRIKCPESKTTATTTPPAVGTTVTTESETECVDFMDIHPDINKLGFIFAVMVAIATGIGLLVFFAPYIIPVIGYIFASIVGSLIP
jgi:hypothetical protein